MLPFLEELQSRGQEESSFQKKILCIIEGDLEFRYITKIFKLFGYEKGCYPLSEEFITIAWGNVLPKNQNIVRQNCEFDGGSSVKGRRVPFPALDAFELYSRDLNIFDSIIVFFDGDKDKHNEVENYFKEEFQNLEITNALLVSMPCFESTLIDFCYCGECRKTISKIENGKYPCDKYKKNFSKLECFDGVKNLIVNLNQQRVDTLTNAELIQVNNLIQNFMSQQ